MLNEDLVRQTRSGSAAALEMLLAQHLSAVRAYARVRMGAELRAREQVSDIVQSACREALQDLGEFEFRGDASFKAWLCVQVERKLRGRARRWRAEKRREPVGPVDGASVNDLSCCYASLHTPSGVAEAQELVTRIEAALDRLSATDRELVVLSRIVGLSNRELAEHIGRDEHSTRTRLSRALARLARHADA